MRPLRRVKKIAGVLLGVLLLAQAALAIAACDWLRVAPAKALAEKSNEPSCHEQPARNANLCLAHCLSADQSADTPQFAIPAWSQASLLVVLGIERSPRRLTTHFTLPRPGAPPPRILFQTFQI